MTMPARSAALQRFLDSLGASMLARTARGETARHATERILGALQRPAPARDGRPERLPVCRHLDAALATAAATAADLAAVTRTFAAIEPELRWYRRTGTDATAEPFCSAHANALVVGPNGIEAREDVWVGCTLLGPHIRYPDHHHPPAEVYLVLSSGEWRRRREAWHTPGAGGIVYNPPDILHAMRSHAKPLFAIWCLSVADA